MNTLQLIAHTSAKLNPIRSGLALLPHRMRLLSVLIIAAAAAVCAAASIDDPVGSPLAALATANAVAAAITFSPVLGLKHLELISFSAVAPGAAGAVGIALAGDSLVVKNSGKPAHILKWWADHQVGGFQQLSFPSGHDTTRGLRLRVRAGEVDSLLPAAVAVEVQTQETMSITIAGSAVGGDVESGSMLIAYDSLPGVQGRWIDWNEFRRRQSKLTTIDFTLTGAAAGYTGAEALTAETDLLLPNRDYAIMGAITGLESATLAIVGPDTGNTRIGLPASDTDTEFTAEFFLRLAREHNDTFIPVLNSGNKANTLVSFVQDENNINLTASLLLALLAEK